MTRAERSIRVSLRRFWRDFEWPVIGLLALVALTLGHVGYSHHFRNALPAYSFWDLLFFDLKLFFLDVRDVERPFHWALNVARFLAPAVAGYTAWQALAELFSDQLQSFRLRMLKGHTVICGLGRKSFALAREFRRRDEPVVVIEQDEENDLVRQCRELGALVLIGDASEPELLGRAGVSRAKHLFALCGDDGVNAEVAVHAAGVVAGREGEPLACVVHIFNPQLCSLLRERELETLSGRRIRLEFFNVFELGARVLLEDYQFSEKAGTNGSTPMHLVVIGVGHLGESLIVSAARQWRASETGGSRKLRVTLVDSDASQIAAALRARYLGLEQVCEMETCEIEIRSALFARAEFLKNTPGNGAPPSIFICLDDDSLSLSAALAIGRSVDQNSSTIFVRMSQDAGLATLLRGIPDAQGRFRHLRAFALLDRACHPEQVLRGTRELLARAIHSEYLRNQRAAADQSERNPSMCLWDDLSEELKESNRQQADDLRGKLEAVGCRMEPLTDWQETNFEFSVTELEDLAAREHARWMGAKLAAGWHHGAVKDSGARTHPCLVPYENLPGEEKQKVRNTVRAIPKFLATVGFRVQRVLNTKE